MTTHSMIDPHTASATIDTDALRHNIDAIAHHVAHPDTKRRFHEAVQVSALKERLTVMQATDEDLLRVHTPEYVQRIKDPSELAKGGDGATPLGKNGFHIAAFAAGGSRGGGGRRDGVLPFQ